MSALIIPIVLTFAGLLLAVATYQSIRRGGARFYTLEREAVLRRAALPASLSSTTPREVFSFQFVLRKKPALR